MERLTAFIATRIDELRSTIMKICDGAGLNPMGFDSDSTLYAALHSPRPGIAIIESSRAAVELDRVSSFLPIVLIATESRASLGADAMKRGVFDLLDAPANLDLLSASIQRAHLEATRIWKSFEIEREIAANVEKLSAREKQVYALLLEGRETRQIAAALEISTSTVEKHRLKVFDKMQVNSVAKLIRLVHLKQK